MYMYFNYESERYQQTLVAAATAQSLLRGCAFSYPIEILGVTPRDRYSDHFWAIIRMRLHNVFRELLSL